MTANKPETAVQGCAFLSLGSHTFVIMYLSVTRMACEIMGSNIVLLFFLKLMTYSLTGIIL